MNRVVDYSDILSAAILPVAFIYFRKELETKVSKRKYLAIPIGVISLCAIWATTLPREQVDMNLAMDEVYELNMSIEEIFRTVRPGNSTGEPTQENLKDSLFYIHFNISNEYSADITALVIIKAASSSTSSIHLTQIVQGYISGGLFTGVNKTDKDSFRSTSAGEFRDYFKKEVVAPLQEGRIKYVYIENKAQYDANPVE